MQKREIGTVVSNVAAADKLHFIKIRLPEISADLVPGNFVSFLPPAESGAFLRRPFSVAGNSDGCLDFVIKNIGKGTAAITALKEGSEVEILGPLGNRYPEIDKEKTVWYLGGGTGIASLFYLNRVHGNTGDIVFWGGKTAGELPEEQLLPAGCILTTDDGSRGEKGNVIQVAEKYLAQKKPDIIVACGPRGLLKGAQMLSEKYGIPTWLSTEEFMACGMGACAGCAVPLRKGGYAKACADGPIFSADEVVL